MSVDALVYNKAALALARLRVDSCMNGTKMETLNRVRTELNSSINLTSLINSTALLNYQLFIAARLSLLEGNYEEAIAKLQSIRHQTPFASNNFDQAYVDLELCYCNYRLHNADLVSAYLAGDSLGDFPTLDIDEQIVAIWMLWQMAVHDSRFGSARALQIKFDTLCASYVHSRTSLLQSLQPFAQ